MPQAESHMPKMHSDRRRRGGKQNQRKTKPQETIGDNEIKPETIVSEKDKLKEKIKTLRSTRTGLERRQQLKVQKQSELFRGKLPKNGAHSLTRQTIHDLLGKFGIHDMQVENDVMHEISSGRVKTPQDVAMFMVRRLNLTHPQGPGGAGGAAGGINSASGAAGGSEEITTTRSTKGNDGEEITRGTVDNPLATLGSSPATSPTSQTTTHRKKLQHPTVSLLK